MAVTFPLQGALREIRDQWKHQQHIGECIGVWNALRLRGLGLIERRPGRRAEIQLHPASVEHPVWLRAASTDPAAYHQVLIEQQYSSVLEPAPGVIIDCGANAGYTSAYFLSRLPAAKVIAIEPFADNVSLCRRNLAPYGDRAQVLEAAVWSHSRRLVIEGQGGREWGVRVRPAREDEAGDVDGIGLAALGLPQIDLLKIDIEGSEEQLFAEGTEAWLPAVKAIAVELHGPACEAAFRHALRDYEGRWSTAGDLTIVRDLRPAKLA